VAQVLGVQVGVVVLNTLMDACCRTANLPQATQLLDDMARIQGSREEISGRNLWFEWEKPWENGKTRGKPWENGKTHGKT